MDQVRAVMTAKHDEGLAYVRDFIIRSGDDATTAYLGRLINEVESDDPSVCLKAYMAILGLLHAWLVILGDKD